VELAGLWGAKARPLGERLAAPDGDGIAWLLRAVAKAERGTALSVSSRMRDLVKAKLSGSRLTTGDLATALGWSERSTRRRFLEHFGYGHMTLIRVLRFRRFVQIARTTSNDARRRTVLVGRRPVASHDFVHAAAVQVGWIPQLLGVAERPKPARRHSPAILSRTLLASYLVRATMNRCGTVCVNGGAGGAERHRRDIMRHAHHERVPGGHP
jgi:AraC-like DNA-binding protein